MNSKTNIRSKVALTITIINIIVIPIFLISLVLKPIEYASPITYQLDTLSKDTYAIYYAVHSRAPAHNYEVITLNCNGNIQTFKGCVNITYSQDDVKPYAIYEESSIVYADKISVYIPSGSLEIQNDVTAY